MIIRIPKGKGETYGSVKWLSECYIKVSIELKILLFLFIFLFVSDLTASSFGRSQNFGVSLVLDFLEIGVDRGGNIWKSKSKNLSVLPMMHRFVDNVLAVTKEWALFLFLLLLQLDMPILYIYTHTYIYGCLYIFMLAYLKILMICEVLWALGSFSMFWDDFRLKIDVFYFLFLFWCLWLELIVGISSDWFVIGISSGILLFYFDFVWFDERERSEAKAVAMKHENA